MSRVLLLALGAGMAAAAAAAAAQSGFIVVGDVGADSARLLVDVFDEGTLNRTLDEELRSPDGTDGTAIVAIWGYRLHHAAGCSAHSSEIARASSSEAGDAWRVALQAAAADACLRPAFGAVYEQAETASAYRIDGLEPDSHFVGLVWALPAATADRPSFVEPFSFRSLGAGGARPRSVVAVSCDRFVEDGDSAHLESLVAAEWGRFATLHLGDQIYADALERQFRAVLSRHAGGASEGAGSEELERAAWVAVARASGGEGRLSRVLLDRFRALYRRTWSRPAARRLMRVGAHLMIPDDHEVMNNFDERQRVAPAWGQFLHAGLRAFAEYQRALVGDDDDQAARTARVQACASDSPGPHGLCLSLREQADALVSGREGAGAGPLARGRALATAHPARALGAASVPASAHVVRVWEGVGLFMLDTRLARVHVAVPGARGGRAGQSAPTPPLPDLAHANALLGDAQWEELQRTLAAWSADDTITDIVVAAATPIMALSTNYARIIEWAEQDRYPTHPAQLPATLQLMRLLRAHRAKLRVLVGGDLHLTAHFDYCPLADGDGPAEPCLPQLVTSGLTLRSTAIHEAKLYLFDWFATHATRAFVSGPDPSVGGGAAAADGWWLRLRSISLLRNYATLDIAARDAEQSSESTGRTPSVASLFSTTTWTAAAALPPGVGALLRATPGAELVWRAAIAPVLERAAWLCTYVALAARPDALRSSGRIAWRSHAAEPTHARQRLAVVAFQYSPLLIVAAQLMTVRALARRGLRCAFRAGRSGRAEPRCKVD